MKQSFVNVLLPPPALAKLGRMDMTIPVSGAANVLESHDAHAGKAKPGRKE